MDIGCFDNMLNNVWSLNKQTVSSGQSFIKAEGIGTNGNGNIMVTGNITGTRTFGNTTVSSLSPLFDDFLLARIINNDNLGVTFGKVQHFNTPISINNEVELEKGGIDEGDITVAPNPTEGLFTLTLPETSSTATIDIFDLQGRKIQSINQGEQQQIQIDLSNETAGLYLVKINIGAEVITKKVLLVK